MYYILASLKQDEVQTLVQIETQGPKVEGNNDTIDVQGTPCPRNLLEYKELIDQFLQQLKVLTMELTCMKKH